MIVLCRIKMASLVLLGGLKVYLHIPDLRTVDGETNYFQWRSNEAMLKFS